MARYFLELCYDGSGFCGWQRQQNAYTVQEACEYAISVLLHEKAVPLTGCGRTDTGVHARKYFAHFDTEIILPQEFIYRINALLPKAVAVNKIYSVKDNCHARFDAGYRTYKYFIHKRKNPFKERVSFALPHIEVDMHQMNEFCSYLIGKKDFSAFEKKGSDNKTSICDVKFASWETDSDTLIFTITADRFLRNMVRAITGTSLMVGSGRVKVEDIVRKMCQKAQINVTLAVPPHGLHLWDIGYEYI